MDNKNREMEHSFIFSMFAVSRAVGCHQMSESWKAGLKDAWLS